MCRSHCVRPVGTRPARGLTLLEMVVVLGIMAVLALVAVKALEPVADQARYEATQRTLTNIEEAILGGQDLRQPDGTPIISGFIADVGRPPLVQSSPAEPQLAELWDGTLSASFPFMLRPGPIAGPASPIDCSDVKLPCGWRGPYLHLGLGASDVRDGWRNALEMLPAVESSPIQAIRWNAVPPYSENLLIDVTRGMVTVSGTVTNDGAVPGASTVVLLYPNPSLSATTLSVMPDSDTDRGTFTFSGVPVGLRAIHAEIDSQPITKYIVVPRNGLSLNLNYVP